MQITHNEALKEIRLAAKNVGLTFKKMERLKISGKSAYKFCDRFTGTIKLSNCTLGGAYENVCSGFISTYDKSQGVFNG